MYEAAKDHFIPIPQIKVTDAGVEEYVFFNFELDLSEFNHEPLTNKMLIQNLVDQSKRELHDAASIDFEGYNPQRVILDELLKKPEIDYSKCSDLLFKLISKVVDSYEYTHGTNGMRNIVMMYKKDIAEKIYKQMLQHFYCGIVNPLYKRTKM